MIRLNMAGYKVNEVRNFCYLFSMVAIFVLLCIPAYSQDVGNPSAAPTQQAAQSNPPAAPTQQAAQSSNTMDTPTFLLVVGSIAGAGVAAARVYIKNREKKIKD